MQNMDHPLDIKNLKNALQTGGSLEVVKSLEDKQNYRQLIVSYPSGDLTIQAYLTIPKGEAPVDGWSVVIFNRGHVDKEAYQVDRQYLRYIDYLAQAGFVVFKSDYRGIGQSEGDPVSLTSADNAIDVLHGILALKKWAEDQDMMLGQMGIWGHSMGAMVALECMIADPELKAGVLWCGFTIPFAKAVLRWSEHHRMSSQAEHLFERYGKPEDNPQLWQEISPVSHLASLGGPIELHHGMKDDKIPYQDSVELDAELKKVGKDGGLYLYENGDHNLSGDDLPVGMDRAAAFFKRQLIPHSEV